MAKKVSFWATKKIKKPTVVKFRRSDGTIAKFKATKTIKKPVKVTFYTNKKGGKKMRSTEIYYEEDLLDIEFSKKVIDGLKNSNKNEIKSLLNKLSLAFIKESENFRKEILTYILNNFKDQNEDFFFRIGKDTLCGNVLILYFILKNHPVINIQNINWYKKLSDLEFISGGAIDLVPKVGGFSIVFDERLVKKSSSLDIANLIEITELLFINNLIKKSIENFNSLLELYSVGDPKNSDKRDILDSLLNNNINKFISCIRKYDSNIKNIEDFLNNYSKIYKLLLESGILVYFDFDDFIFNGVATNENLYPIKYLNKNKQESALALVKMIIGVKE